MSGILHTSAYYLHWICIQTLKKEITAWAHPKTSFSLVLCFHKEMNVSERWPLNLERNSRRVSGALEEHSKCQAMRKAYVYFLVAPHHVAHKLGQSAGAWLGSSWTAWWLKSTGCAYGCSPEQQTWFSYLQLACNLSPTALATITHSSLWIYRVFWSNKVPSTRNSCLIMLSLTIGKIFQIHMLRIWAPKLIWVWGRYCRTAAEPEKNSCSHIFSCC